MLIESHPLNTGSSKRIVEWQPTLFDTPAVANIRMEFEDFKQSTERSRRALFARDQLIRKEIETLQGVVCDLIDAYLEISKKIR